MRDAKKYLESTKKEYEQQLKDIRVELKSMPKGNMVFAIRHKKCYYYNGIGNKRYGITKNSEMIRKLARKRYLQEQRRFLQSNLEIISKTLEKYRSVSRTDILNRMPNGFKYIPQEYFYKKRKDLPYERNPYHPEGLQYIADSGLSVRSKSERLIANLLDEYGVVYLYEAKVNCGMTYYYADFVIPDKHGKYIVWEHLGMMDIQEYEHRAVIKMKDYRQAGYRQWKNLIFTYEEDVANMETIRNIIEEFIIPKC